MTPKQALEVSLTELEKLQKKHWTLVQEIWRIEYAMVKMQAQIEKLGYHEETPASPVKEALEFIKTLQ